MAFTVTPAGVGNPPVVNARIIAKGIGSGWRSRESQIGSRDFGGECLHGGIVAGTRRRNGRVDLGLHVRLECCNSRGHVRNVLFHDSLEIVDCTHDRLPFG